MSRISEKKRAQNRIASVRYRERKRRERESLLDRLSELELKNCCLRKQVDEFSNEIYYLKRLMRDIGMDSTSV
ncbi:hypothetical protein AB6A40_010732 [Gnathostoma spinigerum]|uniref:BZIP domain-containing protein n=1 Tax=Gnathostoma spinigerum TaxID=75299 RepID=A0ABD6EVQ8_9BILA